MCLSFLAKAKIETEDMAPPIQIRKRYNPATRETTLELVRPRKESKLKATFWFCDCGSRVHIDILICSDCGRHQSSSHVRPGELKKLEKTYENLRKELKNVEKELKDVKKDISGKKPCPGDNVDRCSNGPSHNEDCENLERCKCKTNEKKGCGCTRENPPPAPPQFGPEFPQPPFLPFNPCPIPPPAMAPYPMPIIPPAGLSPMPAQFPRHPLPEIRPPPERKPNCPVQPSPAINVIVPECRESKHRKSHRRNRSPSISSSASSTVTIRSFERLKDRIVGLGRRMANLEDREQTREDQRRSRRIQDELRRIRDAEDIARQREELANQYCQDDEVVPCRKRNRTRYQRDCCDDDQGTVRILPFPSGPSYIRRRYRSSFISKRPVVERWSEERQGYVDEF